MGVFKEEAHMFENIARNQTRIFNDAADYGYPFNTKNPPSEVTAVFDSIKSLQSLDKQFPEDKALVRNRQEWKGGVSVDVIIFWERDEGYDCGTKYSISFNNIGTHSTRILKGSDAFISVNAEHYRELT